MLFPVCAGLWAGALKGIIYPRCELPAEGNPDGKNGPIKDKVYLSSGVWITHVCQKTDSLVTGLLSGLGLDPCSCPTSFILFDMIVKILQQGGAIRLHWLSRSTVDYHGSLSLCHIPPVVYAYNQQYIQSIERILKHQNSVSWQVLKYKHLKKPFCV